MIFTGLPDEALGAPLALLELPEPLELLLQPAIARAAAAAATAAAVAVARLFTVFKTKPPCSRPHERSLNPEGAAAPAICRRPYT
jgi:hypothetical protein